jgi:two-component system response regulator HydG
VGELSLGTQGKLLRALQERRVRPIGEEREVEVDVRLICATNRDLKQEVLAGRFREELYYRINVVELHIPPLVERSDDIPPLVDHFLSVFTERFGTGPLALPDKIRQALIHGAYQGNVRELEHAIERMVALSSGGVVDEISFETSTSDQARTAFGLKERVEAFERGLLARELRETGGNRSEAARNLGIGRVTLLDKLKKYGLE